MKNIDKEENKYLKKHLNYLESLWHRRHIQHGRMLYHIMLGDHLISSTNSFEQARDITKNPNYKYRLNYKSNKIKFFKKW